MNSNIGTPEVKSRPAPRLLPPDTQQECIDLPGEEVRCVVHKPKLEIMLRKHRDVVFDIRLFNGMQYTVEADEGDFYNARDKKIVLSARRQKVSFANGERMHLWLSRSFKGSLILKANGKVLGRYKPDQLDPSFYDEDPRTKAAPIIIAMSNEPPTTLSATAQAAGVCTPQDPMGTGKPAAPKVAELSFEEEFRLLTNPPKPTAKPEDQSMHVVEIKPDAPDLPKEVAEFFKRGGEQTALDTTGILTRNWLWAQIVGGAGYVYDNREWVKELWKEKFYLQRVTHKAGPKVYVVFKGNAGLRAFLTGTRYAAEHAKVIAITSGAGSAAGLRHAAWEATKGSVKKAGLLALVFTIALDTAEWLADYEERDPQTGKPKKDIFDLFFKIGLDVAKAGISAVIGSLLIGVLVGFGLLAGGAVIVIGVILATIAVGFIIDIIDKQTGTTDKMNKQLREGADYLQNKMPADYSGYGDTIETALQFGMGA